MTRQMSSALCLLVATTVSVTAMPGPMEVEETPTIFPFHVIQENSQIGIDDAINIIDVNNGHQRDNSRILSNREPEIKGNNDDEQRTNQDVSRTNQNTVQNVELENVINYSSEIINSDINEDSVFINESTQNIDKTDSSAVRNPTSRQIDGGHISNEHFGDTYYTIGNDVPRSDNSPKYHILVPPTEFNKRDGQLSSLLPIRPLLLNSNNALRAADPFEGVGPQSPLFQVQQQLLNSESLSPAFSSSAEYYWDTEGDADYLSAGATSFDEEKGSSLHKHQQQKLSQPHYHQQKNQAQVYQQLRNQPPHPKHQRIYQSPKLNQQQQQQHQQQNQRKHVPSSVSSDAIDTFNIVITKNNSLGLSSTKIKLLPNSQVITHHLGARVTSPTDLKKVMSSAVREAMAGGNPLALEEAIAQVIKQPGQLATVNLINSNMSSLTSLEEALNGLLGAEVVYQRPNKQKFDSLAIGVVKESDESVVDVILNSTIGMPNISSNRTKTNVVNIFIINVLSEQVEPVKKIEEYSNPNIELNELRSRLENKKIPSSLNYVNRLKENIDTNMKKHLVTINPQQILHQQILNTQRHQMPEILNHHGINLNENTVLNLLPDFVRATTIPPVVPIFNTTAHQSLGTKPSVLGLLPNEVFDIQKTTVDLSDNSTGGGVIRKGIGHINPVKQNSAISSFGYPEGQFQYSAFSNLNVEQPPPVPSNPYEFRSNNRILMKRPSPHGYNRAAIIPVPQLLTESVPPVKGAARRQSPNISQTETQTKTVFKAKPTPKRERNTSEPNLFDIIEREEASDVADNYQYSVATKKPKISSTSTKNTNKRVNVIRQDNSESFMNMDMDNMMKAFAIGALPSGVAVASALWPVWAPLVFGKKRRRRDTSIKDTVPAWYSLLNGSRYHPKELKRGNRDGLAANKYDGLGKTSDLAALIQRASSTSELEIEANNAKKSLDDITTTTKRSVVKEGSHNDLDADNINSESEREDLYLHDEDNSFSQTQDDILPETTREYPSSHFYNSEFKKDIVDMTPSINRLQSILSSTESSTKNSVYMTTSHFEHSGKSPAQDVVLVSNFLNTALNGWGSSEMEPTIQERDYIHLNISSIPPGNMVTGITDSPIVLIDKVTGEIKPLSKFNKNETLHLKNSGTELANIIYSLRNKTSTDTASTAAPTTKLTLPPLRTVAATAATTSTTTTTTTTTPAPTPSPGFFSAMATAISNPSPEIADAMSFVGTVTVYGVALMLPMWLPLVVGKRKRRSVADLQGDISEHIDTVDAEKNIQRNFERIVNKIRK